MIKYEIDMWAQQQIWGGIGLILFFIYSIWKSKIIDPILLFGYAYFMLFGIFTGEVVTIFQITLAFLFFITCPKSFIRPIIYFFIVVMTYDAFWFYSNHMYGLLNATTFDATIMACLLPWFFFGKLKKTYLWPCVIMLIFSIFGMKARTAGICLYTTMLLWSIYQKKYPIMWSILALSIVGFVWKGDVLLYSNPGGRLDMWSTYFNNWWQHANHWFGTGFGSFQTFSIQMPMDGQIYRSMHNDYLQILFESGYIGLFIFCLVTARIFWKAKETLLGITSITAYFVACQFYFPLHYFISQFLLILNLIEVFKDE